MPAFKTSAGREYLVRLDANKIRDARAELNIDLADLDFGKVAQRLNSDPVLLVDVLWILCRDQANQSGITSKQFGESLVGDAIDEAARALILARADFSPARTRSLLLRQLETSDRARARMLEVANERMADPATEGRLIKAMEEKLIAEMEEALTRYESALSTPVSSG
jgi:hypothetical protein